MTDCTMPLLDSTPAHQPDKTIFTAWRTVVEEVNAINTNNGESDEIGDARFERSEAAREAVALTPASTLGGLATKVRCVLDDMLSTSSDSEALDILREGGMPDPATIEELASRHLCHLLVQLERASASQAAAASMEVAGLRRLHREIGKAARHHNSASNSKDDATTRVWNEFPRLPLLPNTASREQVKAAYQVYSIEREKVERRLIDAAILDEAERAAQAYHDACDAFIAAPARTPHGITFKLKMMVKAGDDWADCEGVVRNLIADLGKMDDWPSPAAAMARAGRATPAQIVEA